MKNKKAFTLIELLIIVAIISLLAATILTMLNDSRKKARLNGAKTSLKGVMTALVACNSLNGTGIVPNASGGTSICASISNADWPKLPVAYAYVGGGNYSYNCNFQVSTNGDSPANLTCNCVSQLCQ